MFVSNVIEAPFRFRNHQNVWSNYCFIPIIEVTPKCKVKAISGFFPPGRFQRPVGGNSGAKMRQEFTISQLAKAAGIPTTTVRYYERIGLVEPEDRSHGNYRLYGDESLQKLKFIRAAQSIGFTLDDVKALLAAPQSSAAACRDVQSLIEERLDEIGQRLKDLRHVQRVLKSSLEKCKETERADCCHVIETLREKTK